MCGRYKLKTNGKKLAEHFETSDPPELEARYNIAPTQLVPVVRVDPSAHRAWAMQRWGLIPTWATDISIGSKMINARAETLLEKPAFRDPFQKRRCLIPADGFYEWSKNGKSKQPFHFGMKDEAVFAFAGIWDRWKSPEGKTIESCSILTTTPNELLADIHDRMPVILHRNHYDAWLAAPPYEAARLAELLVPFEAEAMKRYPVSPIVNSPKNDLPEAALPVERA
jgi:putative SOS response-associated peptidase YedK